MPDPIYLDYNATTPVGDEAAEAMRPFLEGGFGNPSSVHRFGIEARRAVEHARGQVAALLGCHRDEVIFTSGGSESNNAAITGTAFALRDRGRHIITSAVEHPAVTEVCRWLAGEGFQITWLPVDGTGLVDPEAVEQAITGETILVTIMHANNEVGTIQPVAEIAAIARARGVRVHADGAQAVGKIRAHMDELGVDLYSVAGHKFYAPKGVGALYVRRGTSLVKLIHGADHEQDRRAGTENVLEIAGLGAAAESAAEHIEHRAAHMEGMRDLLQELLLARVPGAVVNGNLERRLPNTLSISFPGVEANAILSELEHVAASAGAACHADGVDLSPVLEAMGIPEETAMGTIRLSTGRRTSEEEVRRAAEELAGAVHRLSGMAPAGGLDEEERRVRATLKKAVDGVDAAEDRDAERVHRAAGEAVEHAAAGYRPSGVTPGEATTPGDEGVEALDGEIRLTRFTRGLGCACKIRPELLERILADLPRPLDPGLLVGTETSDDAAVYQVAPDLALVQTVDFFTPIVDDPYAFGAIAAANALSDIYAMGARPLFALNLVGFPVGRLPLEVLDRILAGAADKASEAGIAIVGGHSVEDPEPKYGMAVTGTVHPDRIIRNAGALPGDVLVLTKAIGTGILSTAAKYGAAGVTAVEECIVSMAALNRVAAEAMEGLDVHACTDVTGFGLIGHLLEMVRASATGAEIHVERVPLLAEALEWATAGIVPGGTKENLAWTSPFVEWAADIPKVERLLLCDAQTSGGLLLALSQEQAGTYVARLQKADVAAALVGRITEDSRGTIRVSREE